MGTLQKKTPFYWEDGPGVQGKRWPIYRYWFFALRLGVVLYLPNDHTGASKTSVRTKLGASFSFPVFATHDPKDPAVLKILRCSN